MADSGSSAQRRTVLMLVGAGLLSVAAALGWRSQRGEFVGSEEPGKSTEDICIVAPPIPYDPLSGVGIHEPRPVPTDARCPVCGMYPARSLAWAAQLVFKNGDTQFFDSPLSLFIFVNNLERYAAGRSLEQVARQYVTNVDGGTWLLAQDAFFVDGSNALGPMRAGNLPAFSSAGAARRFAEQRGGVVLAQAQIDQRILKRLDSRGAHQHPDRP